MQIGKRIREAREEMKFSQGDLGNVTGLRRSYISRVEGGSTVPSRATLKKLAEALDVPVSKLLYDRLPYERTHRKTKFVQDTEKGKSGGMSVEARLVFGAFARAFSKM